MENNVIQNATIDNTNNKIFSSITIDGNESTISQGNKTNALNKIINNIRNFATNRNDYPELLSIMENKPVREIYKEFGVSYTQQNIHSVLSDFFHQASLGILPEDDYVESGNKIKDTALLLTKGISSLAGFGAALSWTDGLASAFKVPSLINAGDKFSALLDSIRIPRLLAKITPKSEGIYKAIKMGGKVGLIGGLTSFIDNNEKYNNIAQAIEKATPDAIYNAVLGAGIPLSGEFLKSPILRGAFTIGLAEATKYGFTGTTTPQDIVTAIKTNDPILISNSIYNALLDIGFGLGAVGEGFSDNYRNEIKENLNKIGSYIDVLNNQVKDLNDLKYFNIKSDIKNIYSDVIKKSKNINTKVDLYKLSNIIDENKDMLQDNPFTLQKKIQQTVIENETEPVVEDIYKNPNSDNFFNEYDSLNSPLTRNKIRDYKLYPLLGNKEQMLSKKFYWDRLKIGAETSDRVIDAFMGTGLNSNILDAMGIKNKKIIKNEFVNTRYKAYVDIKNNKNKVINDLKNHINKIKNILRLDVKFKDKKKLIEDYFKKEISEANSAAYIIAQHVNINNIPIDDANDVGVDIRNDGKMRGWSSIINGKIEFRINKISDILNRHNTDIRHSDAWELVLNEAKDGDLVIFDPDYIAEESGKTVAGYKATKEDKKLNKFMDKFDKTVLTKSKKGVKFIITNTWNSGLAKDLKERGFEVIKIKRRSAKSEKEELVAFNYGTDGRLFASNVYPDKRRGLGESREGLQNNGEFFRGIKNNVVKSETEMEGKRSPGLSNEIQDTNGGRGGRILDEDEITLMHSGIPIDKKYAKQIIERNTLEITGPKDLSVWAYFGNLHYLKDLTDKPEAKEHLNKMYNIIEDANKLTSEHRFNYNEKIFVPLKNQLDIIKDKDIKNKVNEALLKGDALQKDPYKIFDELVKNKEITKEQSEASHKAIDLALEYGKSVLNEYKELPELLQKKYGLDDDIVEKWKQLIYPEISKLKYWMPRVRSVGNVIIEAFKGEKKVHSEPITDLMMWLYPDKSFVAKFYEKKLKERYGNDIQIMLKYPNTKENYSKYAAMDIFQDIMDILTDNDIKKSVKDKIVKDMINKMKSQGFISHSIKRKENVIGGYETNMLQALEKHFAMYNGFYNKQFLKVGFYKLFSEVPSNLTTLNKVMRNMRDEILRNKTYLDKAVAKTRTLMYFKYLAGSIKNGFVNIVFQQPVTAMHLAGVINEGHLNYERSLGIITKAGFDILRGNLTEQEKSIFDTLNRWNVLAQHKTNFYLGRTALNSMAFNKLLDILAIPMGETEKFSRKIAALSFIRTLNKEGLSKDAIADLTKEFVYDTHGVYGNTAMPIALQGEGALKQLGKLGQTFQTYNHSVIMGAIKQLKNKETRIYVAKALMLLGILGGLQIMPLYTTGKNIYQELTGKDADVGLNSVGLRWLNEGLVEDLLGVDVSSSTAFTMPTDELRFSGSFSDLVMNMAFGVVNQSIKDEYKAVDYLFKGDYYKAMYYGIPARFMTYPIKAMQEHKMGLTTNGDILLIDPDTNKPLKLTEKEYILQSLGFTPTRISEYKQMYYAFKSINQYWNTQKQRMRNKLRLAIINNDMQAVRKYTFEMQRLNQKIIQLNREGYAISPLTKTPKIMHTQGRFLKFMSNNFRR